MTFRNLKNIISIFGLVTFTACVALSQSSDKSIKYTGHIRTQGPFTLNIDSENSINFKKGKHYIKSSGNNYDGIGGWINFIGKGFSMYAESAITHSGRSTLHLKKYLNGELPLLSVGGVEVFINHIIHNYVEYKVRDIDYTDGITCQYKNPFCYVGQDSGGNVARYCPYGDERYLDGVRTMRLERRDEIRDIKLSGTIKGSAAENTTNFKAQVQRVRLTTKKSRSHCGEFDGKRWSEEPSDLEIDENVESFTEGSVFNFNADKSKVKEWVPVNSIKIISASYNEGIIVRDSDGIKFTYNECKYNKYNANEIICLRDVDLAHIPEHRREGYKNRDRIIIYDNESFRLIKDFEGWPRFSAYYSISQ